jgi:hypothetical protein
MPVLLVLGALTAIPARAGFLRCGLSDDGMADTPLSSPVTFAQFCGSSFNSVPLQQVLQLGALDTSIITGVEIDFTVSNVLNKQGAFVSSPVNLFFNGGTMGDIAPLGNTLFGGCTAIITGVGSFTAHDSVSTNECAVSQTDDTAFLNQLQKGLFFIALAGANGQQFAEYSDASVTFFTSASVPEPSTATSVMAGIAILAALRRRVRRG